MDTAVDSQEHKYAAMTGYAVFSRCGKYRYRLARIWDDGRPLLGVLMLNPSKAGAAESDQTVTLLLRRIIDLDEYGGCVVTNLRAYIATDPLDMERAADPTGPLNDQYIQAMIDETQAVLLAYGQPGKHMERKRQVLQMLKAAGKPLWSIKTTADGTPCHPLRLAYSLPLTPWVMPAWF